MRRRTLTIDEDTHTKLKGLAVEAGWPMSKVLRVLLGATSVENNNLVVKTTAIASRAYIKQEDKWQTFHDSE